MSVDAQQSHKKANTFSPSITINEDTLFIVTLFMEVFIDVVEKKIRELFVNIFFMQMFAMFHLIS